MSAEITATVSLMPNDWQALIACLRDAAEAQKDTDNGYRLQNALLFIEDALEEVTGESDDPWT